MLRIIFFSAFFLLSGCGSGAPECDSEQGYAKVREVIYKMAQNLLTRKAELPPSVKNDFSKSFFDRTEESIASLNVYRPQLLVYTNAEEINSKIRDEIGLGTHKANDNNISFENFVRRNINDLTLKINFIGTKKLHDREYNNRKYTNICQTTLSIEPVGLDDKKNLSLNLVYSVNAPPVSTREHKAAPFYFPVHFFEASLTAAPLVHTDDEKKILIAMGVAQKQTGTPKPVSAEIQLMNLVLQGFLIALAQ